MNQGVIYFQAMRYRERLALMASLGGGPKPELERKLAVTRKLSEPKPLQPKSKNSDMASYPVPKIHRTELGLDLMDE